MDLITLDEMIQRLDAAREPFREEPDDLATALHLDDSEAWRLNQRKIPGMEQSWISRWYDTDKEVGHRAIYLHGEFVGMCRRTEYMAVAEFIWASEAAAWRVRSHVRSLLRTQEQGIRFKVFNGQGQIKTHYRVRRDDQILPCHIGAEVLCQRRRGHLKQVIRNDAAGEDQATTYQVALDDGTVVEVPLNEMLFALPLRPA